MSAAAYYIGRRRAFAVAGGIGGVKRLHSRPAYYGALAALWCGIPALVVFGCWRAFRVQHHHHPGGVRPALEIRGLPADRLNLVVNDIRNLVSGNIVSPAGGSGHANSAGHYRSLKAIGNGALAVVVIALGLAAFSLVWRITPTLRARNQVEGDPDRPAHRLLHHRHLHHHRHRPVRSVRVHPVFQGRSRHRFSLRPEVEPADGHPGTTRWALRAPSGPCRCSRAPL